MLARRDVMLRAAPPGLMPPQIILVSMAHLEIATTVWYAVLTVPVSVLPAFIRAAIVLIPVMLAGRMLTVFLQMVVSLVYETTT